VARLLHDVGMSIHRADHEAYSLFMAQERLQPLLAEVYDEPERTVVISEILHAIIGHRRRGEPYTVEAGVVRVADALDMAEGRSRIPVEGGTYGIHALSAAAIDTVNIEAGEERPVKIEIEMNNSAGIFQVDDLLATKLRGTPLEGHVEVVAEVSGETEKRLPALVQALDARAPRRPRPLSGGEAGGALDADAADRARRSRPRGQAPPRGTSRNPSRAERRSASIVSCGNWARPSAISRAPVEVLARRHDLGEQSHRERLLGLDDPAGDDHVQGRGPCRRPSAVAGCRRRSGEPPSGARGSRAWRSPCRSAGRTKGRAPARPPARSPRSQRSSASAR